MVDDPETIGTSLSLKNASYLISEKNEESLDRGEATTQSARGGVETELGQGDACRVRLEHVPREVRLLGYQEGVLFALLRDARHRLDLVVAVATKDAVDGHQNNALEVGYVWRNNKDNDP